ncbi:MAG: RecQ family ATP-dependent DNA helicase, partial [Candidatus Absconditabacteria bacterium]
MKIGIIDLEISAQGKVMMCGLVDEMGNNIYYGNDISLLIENLKNFDTVMGHNIINHDLNYIVFENKFDIHTMKIIDTLRLSSLIFIRHPYHRLIKDYKLDKENDPIEDAKLSLEVFENCCIEYKKIDIENQNILYTLLKDTNEFKTFFQYLIEKGHNLKKCDDIKKSIKLMLGGFLEDEFFEKELDNILDKYKLEFSYVFRLLYIKKHINKDVSVLPGWIVKNLTNINYVLGRIFRFKKYDCKKELKEIFGYDEFKSFPSYDGTYISQETVVKETMENQDILAIFATGGGKSLTFQLPALIISQHFPYLTIVISPLQSLMKDQVDILNTRFNVHNVGFINGTLNPLERREMYEKVEFGGIDMLYISPEQLRSQIIKKIISKRLVNRIVIDEAHCISKRGHDFRIDYMFITEFVKEMRKVNSSFDNVKISCFTATGKADVIGEIKEYFHKGLDKELVEFKTVAKRDNLVFNVIETVNEEDRFYKLIELLENEVKDSPCIIFTRYTGENGKKMGAQSLSENINKYFDSENKSSYYHGRMKSEVKSQIQDNFVNGKLNLIVATNAFGMGVDKENVRYVIHYGIPSSIENYVQEAGRGGRDGELSNCIILYNENDLNENLQLNKASQVKKNEIKNLLTSIKQSFKYQSKNNNQNEYITSSIKDIVKRSGRIQESEFEEKYNTDKTVWETKAKTSLYFLEKGGFISRKFNNTKVRATSQEIKMLVIMINKLDEIKDLDGEEKEKIKEILKLIKNSKAISIEDIGYEIGWHFRSNNENPKKGVQELIKILKEYNLIDTDMEIITVINIGKNGNSLDKLKESKNIIAQIFNQIDDNLYRGNEIIFDKLDLNTKVSSIICKPTIKREMESLLNYMKEYKLIDLKFDRMLLKHDISTIKTFILETLQEGEILIKLMLETVGENQKKSYNICVVNNLEDLHKNLNQKLGKTIGMKRLEGILKLLNKLDIISVQSSLFVYHNKYQIFKGTNFDNQYTDLHFEDLKDFYTSKIQQGHIMNEYVKYIKHRLNHHQFVEDYFNNENSVFLKKYFKNRLGEIKRPISQEKYNEIYKGLSEKQKQVLESKENLLVIAGPGAGKTKCLVHKVASIILEKGLKNEEFLMLTYSRSAKQELKERVVKMLGSSGYYLEIDTFHGYCFRKLGILPSQEMLEGGKIIKEYIKYLNENPDIILPYQVLMIDEFQDINDDQFKLISIIQQRSSKGDKMITIATGDDDQNIYGFQGGNIKHIQSFKNKFKAQQIILDENYRSTQEIIDFSNKFIENVDNRIKSNANFKSILSIKQGIFNSQSIIDSIDCSGDYSNSIVDILEKRTLTGKKCIICHDNITCMNIHYILEKNGYNSKLISDGLGYRIESIIEISHFLRLCNDEGIGVNQDNIEDKYNT